MKLDQDSHRQTQFSEDLQFLWSRLSLDSFGALLQVSGLLRPGNGFYESQFQGREMGADGVAIRGLPRSYRYRCSWLSTTDLHWTCYLVGLREGVYSFQSCPSVDVSLILSPWSGGPDFYHSTACCR